jgi:hypothetical protein
VRADHQTRFGALQGPDPAQAGSKGGRARRRVSLAAAIQQHAEEHPEHLAAVVRALFETASSGRSGAVEAAKVLLDRIDGPVSLGVEAHVARDHTIILRVGADGRPVPGYEHPPALPPELEEGQEGLDEGARAAWAEVVGPARVRLPRR